MSKSKSDGIGSGDQCETMNKKAILTFAQIYFVQEVEECSETLWPQNRKLSASAHDRDPDLF